MKKGNLKLPKRLLSMSLALSMCLGMACTTAFANEADEASENVYVYVGVDVVDTEDAEEFTITFDGDKTQLDSTKADLDKAAESIDKTKEDLKDQPTFEAPKNEEGHTLTDVIETAKGDVNGALENLEKADKPTYPPADTPESGNPAAAKEPTFAEEVNGKVGDFNAEQKATDGAASADASKADADSAKLNNDQAKVDEDLEEAKGKLEEAQHAATEAVDKANDAVKACEDEKVRLDAELSTQIASLGERPSETAPVRQEDQSEADYVAAHNAWVQACEDYNAALKTIQESYNNAAEALAVKAAQAEAEVKTAQDALQHAADELAAYNRQAQAEYGNLQDKAGDIQDLHDKLDEYNNAVNEANQPEDGYNHVAGEYNKAAGEYNNAVKDYNEAVKDYNNTDVKDYNDKVDQLNGDVTKYNTEAGKYNTEAGEYNTKVTEYNDQATGWNNKKAEVDLLADELKNLGTDITVDSVKNALSLSDNFEELSDEEYNAKVREYNAAVEAYNKAVADFNTKLSQNHQAVIDKVVSTYFQSDAQTWTTPETTGDTHWYTLGKISVAGSEFAQHRDDFGKDSPNGLGDIYTWEVGSDGKVTGTPESNKIHPSEKDNFEAFEKMLANGKNTFQEDSKVNKDSAYQGLMKDGINKWVLTSADGANSGTQGTSYIKEGTTTWHLNGYLKVTKLSTLATLEERAVRADAKKEGIGEKAKEEQTIDGAPLELLNLYEEHKPEQNAPEIQVPDPETWSSDGAEFGGVNLDTTLPGELTVGERLPIPTVPDVEDEEDEEDDDTTTPPVVDVPDPEIPLVEEPEIDIPEPEVPLAEEPEIEVPDEEVPLAEVPQEMEIADEEVPLADVPKTGDISTVWYAAALTSACALCAILLRKKEEEH